jgi:hypothetical protein
MRITQSILGQADKCMLSAQFTLDKPAWFERTGSATRALGTAYHAGLELHYTARRDRLPLPTLDDVVARAWEIFDLSTTVDLYDNSPIERFLWDDKIPDTDTARELLTELVTLYFAEHAWPDTWAVLGVEVDQVVNMDGHQFKLGADLVLQDPNGWVVLVDHKTAGKAWAEGKADPRKNNQSALYTELARTIWPDAPGHRFVFDVMVLPGKKMGAKFERIVTDPSTLHGQAVVKKALDFVAMYETVHVQMGRDLPANPASTLCNPKWCDFFAGCPHGAALDT